MDYLLEWRLKFCFNSDSRKLAQGLSGEINVKNGV